MYSESYAEISLLVQQYIKSIEVGKLKVEALNDLFGVLSRLGVKDRRTNLQLKSVLSEKPGGKRIGYSTLNEVYKYLKTLKKPKNDNPEPLCEIFDEYKQNVGRINKPSTYKAKLVNKPCTTYRLRSSRQLPKNHSLISVSEHPVHNLLNGFVPTVPTPVYLTNTSTEQGEPSQSNFLQYFGLGPSGSEYHPENSNSPPSLNMSMFNNSTNVPFSSDLGRLLAVRVNHNVSEDFKLRKIERLERYINKSHTEKNENIVYPVTYVDKNRVIVPKKNISKTKNSVCKSVSVVLEKVDLLALRRKIRKRSRDRKRYHLNKLKKTCKELKVVLRASDRLLLGKVVKKKKKIS